jgi:hypothetical protein
MLLTAKADGLVGLTLMLNRVMMDHPLILTRLPQLRPQRRARNLLVRPRKFRLLHVKRKRKGVGIYREGCLRCEERCSCPFELRKKRNGKILPFTALR